MKNVGKMLSIFTFKLLMVVPLFSWAQSGAELYRTDGYRYGKFEASIQFAGGNGVISSFFLWKDKSEQQDVYWNEIDIEKFGDDCSQFLSNLLYGLPQSNHVVIVDTEADLCAGFHTYTIEWTPDRITWFVDGVQMRESTPEDAAVYMENAEDGMQFRFNIWVGNAEFGGVLDTAILPVHQYIDWVRYSEYTPGEGDEGTDFTLSWREDFDSEVSGVWQRGNWASPYNLSIHHPGNVNFQDGMAILSLTEEGKEAYLEESDADSTPDSDGDNDASVSDDEDSDNNKDAGCGCNAVGSARGTDDILPTLGFLLHIIFR
jgi:endo-1,3-1,4-beta-glycanase ExoK